MIHWLVYYVLLFFEDELESVDVQAKDDDVSNPHCWQMYLWLLMIFFSSLLSIESIPQNASLEFVFLTHASLCIPDDYFYCLSFVQADLLILSFFFWSVCQVFTRSNVFSTAATTTAAALIIDSTVHCNSSSFKSDERAAPEVPTSADTHELSEKDEDLTEQLSNSLFLGDDNTLSEEQKNRNALLFGE